MKNTKKKDKQIAQIQMKEAQYSIRATIHCLERMEERNIDEYVIVGNIIALGPETLAEIKEKQEEAIIIDEEKAVSIVFGFKKNTVRIITVIDKGNVFVKKNTRIERL